MSKRLCLSCMNLPEDVKRLSDSECEELCVQLRRTIIKTVLLNGGHLSSNLGTVELAVALHRVFSSPYDKMIWDVGHQSYAHKLLTGRAGRFESLRKEGGLSGFLKPSESEHDAFISGHSSNSVSAALGIAEAMRLKGVTKHKAIAIIGDGALTGGLAYEGLNNAGKSGGNIIVILNHNEMSISKNVGALAKHLTVIRGSRAYLETKKKVKELLNQTPLIGAKLERFLKSSKSALKQLLYHSTMFENLGFAYIGPVDGHSISELEEAFRIARRIDKPVLIHVITVKGKGFRPAEKNPGAYHAVPSCGYKRDNPLNIVHDSYSEHFGKTLVSLAEDDPNICAVTAAMKHATGLQHFSARYPERFFDAGIAEQHAVAFSGALAKGGMLPVFAVYSSFLQRAYDQLFHDAAIDKLHIVIGVDRAGLVGEDGETHQGLYDIAMLKTIPNTAIYSPSCMAEVDLCLKTALYSETGIACVRYPKGGEERAEENNHVTDEYKLCYNSSDTLAISYGRAVNNIYEAMKNSGHAFDVLKLVKVYPLSEEVFKLCEKYKRIVIFEEGCKTGGIGEYILAELALRDYKGGFKIIAVGDGFVPQSSVSAALKKYHLDAISAEAEVNQLTVNNVEVTPLA
ncbi:MAG: 1-deoxy-D-xylulose-5-phosphate synthase [Oscillospiraceae bacterium]|nr:1-deoxy-D-xylulose-5-phosphate synthase [Oscillospiraceae bacterium]